MRLKIDGVEYNVDLTKPIQFYKLLYAMARGEGLRLGNGQIFRVDSSSLIRTALKIVITPVVLPLIKSMYKERGLELIPPPKHTDLIDYCVASILDFCILSQEHLNVDIASEASEDSSRTVKSIAAAWGSIDKQSRDAQLIDATCTPDN